jgi:hypothetical protein
LPRALFDAVLLPLSSGATNLIGRLGGVMSSRSASKTCLSWLRVLRLNFNFKYNFTQRTLLDDIRAQVIGNGSGAQLPAQVQAGSSVSLHGWIVMSDAAMGDITQITDNWRD